ncbi:response regulator [Mesorhizobium sp. A623]
MNASSKEAEATRPLLLCVEDEDDLRIDLVEELEEAGYTVLEASNGAQAMAQLAAVNPDLILCDVNMPVQNGYDLLREVRKTRPDLADVPFVFLTALADPKEVADGKRAGADDYLVKPIDFELMLATIGARLRQVSRMRDKVAAEVVEIRGALANLQEQETRSIFDNTVRVLDYVALGIVLLDRHGQVRFANRTARDYAGEDDGLIIGETMKASLADHSTELKRIISATIDACLKGDDQVMCLTVPRPSGRRDLLVLACTLAGQDDGEGTAAAMFISDPERRPCVPENVLCGLFGLTPTEAQIALALAEGKRPDYISASFGVSPTTTAFHMRNLFRKTSTNRQADLIALVLAGPMAMTLD